MNSEGAHSPAQTGCLNEDEAIALLEATDEGSGARWRTHLSGCESCQEYLAALARVLLPPSEATAGGWGPEDDVLRPGTRLGQYVVEAMIGRGGMGAVYRAHDERLDRAVAIKVLQQEVGQRRVVRLRREASVMAKISHPNIAEVFDFGQSELAPFVVMELIRGMTLAEWTRGERTPAERLQAYVQAGHGLLAAHQAGIVHRDFKPSNAMVVTQGDTGRVKVLDFGLAGAHGGGLASAGALAGSSTHSVLGGTPRYAAPEQFVGDPVTPASDQFSFCVALFEALTGTVPFGGRSGSARRTAMLRGELRSMPPSIPASVARALERGLSLRPASRFGSMREETQLEVAENLVLLLAQYVMEPARAAYWAAEAVKIAADGPDADRGRAELLLGWVAQASGQPEQALAHYDRAEPLLRGDGRHRDALEDAARANLTLQRWDEGRAGLEAAIAEYERELGAAHPDLAKPLNTLASLEIMAENFDEAAKLLERAVALTPEGDLMPRAAMKGNLALLLKRTGELERALSIFEEILQEFEGVFGGQHESVIRTELAIIEVLTLMERSDEALRRIERALKLGVPDEALSRALFARASLVEDPRPDLRRILTLPDEPESTYAAGREGLATLDSAP